MISPAHAVPVPSPARGLGWDADTSSPFTASLFQPDAETLGAIELRKGEVREKQPPLMGYNPKNLPY